MFTWASKNQGPPGSLVIPSSGEKHFLHKLLLQSSKILLSLFFFLSPMTSLAVIHAVYRGENLLGVVSVLWSRAVRRMQCAQSPPVMSYNREKKMFWMRTDLESSESRIFLSSVNWDILRAYESLKKKKKKAFYKAVLPNLNQNQR